MCERREHSSSSGMYLRAHKWILSLADILSLTGADEHSAWLIAVSSLLVWYLIDGTGQYLFIVLLVFIFLRFVSELLPRQLSWVKTVGQILLFDRSGEQS